MIADSFHHLINPMKKLEANEGSTIIDTRNGDESIRYQCWNHCFM